MRRPSQRESMTEKIETSNPVIKKSGDAARSVSLGRPSFSYGSPDQKGGKRSGEKENIFPVRQRGKLV